MIKIISKLVQFFLTLCPYLVIGCVNHSHTSPENNTSVAKSGTDSNALLYPAAYEADQFKMRVKQAETLTIDIYDNCSYYDRKFIESLRYSAGADPASHEAGDSDFKGLPQAGIKAARLCKESHLSLKKAVPIVRRGAIQLFQEWRKRIKLNSSSELHISAKQSFEDFKIKYASMMASIRIVLLAREEIRNFLEIYHGNGFQSEEEFTRSKAMAIRMFEEETKVAFKDIRKVLDSSGQPPK